MKYLALALLPWAAAAARAEGFGYVGAGEARLRGLAAPATVTGGPARGFRAEGASLTLSELAERLSREPQTLERLIDSISARGGWDGKGWFDLGSLPPQAKQELAQALREMDKSFLDSFPALTLSQVKVLLADFTRDRHMLEEHDGPYVQELRFTGKPGRPPEGAFLNEVAPGLYHGDKTAMGLASSYGDNLDLSAALNRLAMNGPGQAVRAVLFNGKRIESVRALFEEFLAAGHTLTVKDMRFFANFGDLWLKDGPDLRPVVTPLYIKTGLRLPSGRELVLPVTHSHLQISLRGSSVNADLTYFFGVNGAAAFAPLATEDQPWTGGRAAHAWAGVEALALLERAALTRRELKLKAERHGLPMGGYGPLGACNDIQALITGFPIYPQVRESRYYSDGMTMDSWAAGLPADGDAAPDPRRILDSLPFTDPEDIPIPAVRDMVRELKGSIRRTGGEK